MIKDREIYNEAEWEARKQKEGEMWLEYNRRRHENILKFGIFKDMPKDYSEAVELAYKKVQNAIEIPSFEIDSSDKKYIYNDFNMFMEGAHTSKDKMNAFHRAHKAISFAANLQKQNSMYSYSNDIASTINHSYRGVVINPYECQVLFETTSLGYRGVMIPIEEAFSTTLSIATPYLEYADIKALQSYFIEKDVLSSIRKAVIDAYVYGGGIITPVFEYKGAKQYIESLRPMEYYFGKEIKYDSLLTFDRYCVMPSAINDGLASMRLMSDMPMVLQTIFNDREILQPEYCAAFSMDTTTRSKFIRPDNFGVSIFARASKAIYNYEQQLQFLNYALGQLSIIVFNSKTNDYMSGAGADTAWNSMFGGGQVDDIRSQLAVMQQTMNNERGLFLNDVEVTALNRTFTGIDSIINAMNQQAALAFGVKQEQLFGDKKSGVQINNNSDLVPIPFRLREKFRSQINKVMKWVVFGFFAERGFERSIDNNNNKVKFTKDEFFNMIHTIEVVYNDSIKSEENILKEAGINEILKLVEGRVIPISAAAAYISSIPLLSKVYNRESDDYKEWLQSIQNLQQKGTIASIQELDATIAINEAIANKKNPLAPRLQDQIKELESHQKDSENDNNSEKNLKNEKKMYNYTDPTNIPLEDLGELDDNGIVRPVPVDKTQQQTEVTQRFRKRKSHE